jgi:fumarate hydratase class II
VLCPSCRERDGTGVREARRAYDKASAIAHKASREGTTLREAAIATGYVTAADFDRIVDPAAMAGEPQ